MKVTRLVAEENGWRRFDLSVGGFVVTADGTSTGAGYLFPGGMTRTAGVTQLSMPMAPT
jgi:hypothetical protein